MNKDIRLNQKATTQVVNDLIESGFIKRSVVKDGAFGRKRREVTWTKDGTKMVASYANALRSIRNPTKRKIEAFNAFLTIRALNYMAKVGWID